MVEQTKLSVREATRLMIEEVTEDVIEKCVVHTMTDPHTPSVLTSVEFLDRVVAATKSCAPEFVQATAYIHEFAKLNSPVLWASIYEHTTLPTRVITRPIHPGLPGSLHIEADRDLFATSVSEGNDAFFTPYTIALASSVFGAEYAEAFQGIVDPGNAEALFAISDQARSFHSRPRRTEEVLERLEQVFPMADGPQKVLSGYDSLARRHSFRHEREFGGKLREKKCPAPNLTAVIYQSYGRILRDPSYRSCFVSAVERKVQL